MRFISLDSNNAVISIRIGTSAVSNEIQSDIGELGQIRQADGSFIDPTPINETPQPTLEDKVNYIYYKEKGIIA